MSSDQGLAEEVVKAEGFMDFVSFANIGKMYDITKDFKLKTESQFGGARQRAKETGLMLAHFLASENSIFKGQTITLCGYSLGTSVCKQTINRLGKMNRTDLIHNVLMLAGATYVKSEKSLYQRQVLSRVVNGRVMNIYSKNDDTVLLFEKLAKRKAIGRHAIFEKDI